MKMAATTMKVGMMLPLLEARVCPLRMAGYRMRNPRAESLSTTTSWLTIEGSISVMACGNEIVRKVWNGVSPMAKPASRWPWAARRRQT